MTSFDEDHGLLLDEGMMGAQVRTLYRSIRVSGPGESILINRSSKSPIERLELALGTVRTKSGQMVCKRFSDHSGR